jgi:hypothetical protein
MMKRADALVALSDVTDEVWVARGLKARSVRMGEVRGSVPDAPGPVADDAADDAADDFHGCDDCNDLDDVADVLEDAIEDAAEILAVSAELVDDGWDTSERRAAASLPDNPTVAELMRTRRRVLARR